MRLRLGSFAFASLLLACSPDDAMGDGSATETSNGTADSTTADSGETGVIGDCGNDLREEGEECDGVDLGGTVCADLNPAFAGGTLACGASCTFDASGCMLAPDTPLVALNEITSNSIAMSMTPNDAFELHNAGTAAADLSGWKMSDDPTFPALKTYVFPAGSTLAAGDFLVLLSIDSATMSGDLPFGISDHDVETITLADAAGTTVDTVDADGFRARVSYCRLPDGTGPWFQCEQTFGAANQLAATACGNGIVEDAEQCDSDDLAGNTCADLGLGYSGGTLACSLKCNLDPDGCTTSSDLVLNEIDATSDDIEIYNAGAAAIDLSGLVLTDDAVDQAYDAALDMAELVFPQGTMLGPDAYLVVSSGLGPGQHPFGLGLAGDEVTLLDPAGPTVIDQTKYGDGDATISFCRQPNGPGGAWTADCTATMGSPN